MESVARAKYLRMSPRKLRRVAELVKGKMVHEAVDLLRYVPKRASVPLSKTIKSAAANMIAQEGTTRVKAEELRVTSVIIDGGPILKRFRAVGMGRAFRIRKRTCHLAVKVSDEGRAERRLEKEQAKRTRKRKPTKPSVVEEE
ncbi:MAG: 50S ribosomal protein L22 [candidate division Zixibacteria bacterium]|nr:50S ribosomal protein L22 [candidate division Zixibacteria bacterium]